MGTEEGSLKKWFLSWCLPVLGALLVAVPTGAFLLFYRPADITGCEFEPSPEVATDAASTGDS